MNFSVKDWYYKLCKGKIRSFIARGKESQEKVYKTVLTIYKKGYISRQGIDTMLLEVENETVTPFINWEDYPERRERLNELRESLL